VVSWSGDTPGLTKLMGITGHNSYQGCRYCNLRGIFINHIYYPTTPPKGFNSKRYDATNLPNRTHKEWQERLKLIRKAKTGTERNQLINKYGNNYFIILFLLFK
jgi:hypothetical protein